MSDLLLPSKQRLIAFTPTPVKSLEDFMFEGYLIAYYKGNERDFDGQWFDGRTDFMKSVYPIVGRPVLYDHGLNPSIGVVPIGEFVEVTWDEGGAYIKGVNDFAARYKAYLEGLDAPDQWIEEEDAKAMMYQRLVQQRVQRGMMGMSAGALPQSFEMDEATGHIKRWAVMEGSLTRTECDPRRVASQLGQSVSSAGTRVYPLKQFQLAVKSLPETLIGSNATREASQTEQGSATPQTVANININLHLPKAPIKGSVNNMATVNNSTGKKQRKTLEEIVQDAAVEMAQEILTELSAQGVVDEDEVEVLNIPQDEEVMMNVVQDETMRAVKADMEAAEDVDDEAAKKVIAGKKSIIVEAAIARYMTQVMQPKVDVKSTVKSAFKAWAAAQPATSSTKSKAGGFTSQFNINTGAVKASLLDVVQAQAGIDPFNFRKSKNPMDAALQSVVYGKSTITGQIGQNAGFRTNAMIASDFIEPLYNDTVILKAGARPRTFPEGTRQITVRKRNSAARASFGGESQTTTEGKANDGFVTFNLKPIVVEYVVSQEELKFADADFEQQLIEDARMVASIRVDESALRGTGAVVGSDLGAEFLGVRNSLPSGQVTSLSGANITYAQLVGMKTKILNRKIKESDSWGYIFNHNIEEYLETLEDLNGQPIFAPYTDRIDRRIRGIPYHPTLQVPSNLGGSADQTEVYCGDWRFLEVARITDELDVVTDPSVLRRSREVLIQLVMYADVAVTRPEAFEIYSAVGQ